MARKYDPVLGRWIHGLPDDTPEFGPVSDEPITISLDGSWQDIDYTTSDKTHFWRQPRADRCLLCWADPGECTHTGWIPDETWNAAIVDDESPIRIPPAERAGPAMIGDGVLRGQVTGVGWPKVLERLAAIDTALVELARLHAPSVEMNSRGKLCLPECQGCFDTSGCREEWPCESATILLRRVGLTERDLDYQLGDADDGGVQGA